MSAILRTLALAAAAVALPVMAAENLVTNPSFEGDEMAFSWGRMESPRQKVKDKDDPRYVGKFDIRRRIADALEN
jgi:hypothetical protein